MEIPSEVVSPRRAVPVRSPPLAAHGSPRRMQRPSSPTTPGSRRSTVPAAPAFALTIALASVLAPIPSAWAATFDRVAVVVNGDIITLSELEERAGPSLPPRAGPDDGRRRDLLRAAADQLVAEKLLAAEVAREG